MDIEINKNNKTHANTGELTTNLHMLANIVGNFTNVGNIFRHLFQGLYKLGQNFETI